MGGLSFLTRGKFGEGLLELVRSLGEGRTDQLPGRRIAQGRVKSGGGCFAIRSRKSAHSVSKSSRSIRCRASSLRESFAEPALWFRYSHADDEIPRGLFGDDAFQMGDVGAVDRIGQLLFQLCPTMLVGRFLCPEPRQLIRRR